MATPTTNAAPRSFDRARFYTIDGQQWPSVTTVLDIIAKPARILVSRGPPGALWWRRVARSSPSSTARTRRGARCPTPTGPATSRCAGPRSPKGRLEPLLDLLDLKAVPAGDFRLPKEGSGASILGPGRSSTSTPYRSAVRP
jgi:hypothetical protein